MSDGSGAAASSRPARRCPICGQLLDPRARRHAKLCSGSCRAEASRLARLLAGEEADGMTSIAEWLARRRLRRPLGPGAVVDPADRESAQRPR